MKRVQLSVAGVMVLAAWLVPNRMHAAEPEVFEREVQASGQAWQYSGVDLPLGYVAIIKASGKWTYLNEKLGPGGGNVKVPKDFVKYGANFGCLLVKSGDTILPFNKDDDTITITTPGKIYFCCNALPSKDGSQKAKHFIHAIPIEGNREPSKQDFASASGFLKARISVKQDR